MKILLLPAVFALTLSACAATPTPPVEGSAPPIPARIGKTVYVDGPKVTPLEVLEDSRCPMNARCVWAGRFKLRVRIDLGSRSEIRDLIRGEPIQVADGSLGSRLIDQSQKMTVAARATAEKKTVGHRS